MCASVTFVGLRWECFERAACEDLLQRDRALVSGPAEEADDPREQRYEAVLEAGQEDEMHDQP